MEKENNTDGISLLYEEENKEIIPFYPSISERIRAAVTDSIVVVAFIMIIALIFSLFDNVPQQIRISLFIFIFFLYDPFFTSFFGGTIGHRKVGIRVKRENDEEKNIIFPIAIIRYIIKVSLGWVSLFTVGTHKKKQAIHDIVAKSIVVYY